MKVLKTLVVVLFGAALLIPAAGWGAQEVREKFRQTGVIDEEKGDALASAMSSGPSEAPTGFDNLTNGFNIQGPPFDSIDEENVVPLRSFNDNRFIFEEAETAADGLGPTYNGQSCRECHQNVVTGGASQIAEHRTGRMDQGVFFESPGARLSSPALLTPTLSSG